MSLLEVYIQKLNELGIQKDDKILVAVSGGVDSVVLLRLTANAGYNVAAAHVNFKLRGVDSDKDEAFVVKVCQELNIPLYSTQKPVDKNSENVQIAAREARYAWFEEVYQKHHFKYVFTAHHLNDRIETFFIHLIRGSGIKGLRSIPQTNYPYVRPLLEFSKNEILAYANENEIAWREDVTNLETDYLRNKIRHGLAKDYAALAPFANENLVKSMDILDEANTYFEAESRRIIHSAKRENGLYFFSDEEWIDLFTKKPLHKYVFDFFGFTADQLTALSTFGESQTGKKIESATHVVYRDRNQFVISEPGPKFEVEIPIHLPKGEVKQPISLKWDVVENPSKIHQLDLKTAVLALSKLHSPLVLRYWKPGDRFVPAGMKGSKKLSDFLIDLKLSIPEKEKVMVIESSGKICWVAGLRIDDRFKWKKENGRALVIHMG